MSQTLCQRRWDRRGRGLADFAFSFFLSGISHILAWSFRLSRQSYEQIRKLMRNKKIVPQAQSQISLLKENRRVVERHAKFTPVTEKSKTRFIDVAGLEDAKRDIMLRMILPLQYPEKAQKLGIRQGGGLLLYGPPGNGKPFWLER